MCKNLDKLKKCVLDNFEGKQLSRIVFMFLQKTMNCEWKWGYGTMHPRKWAPPAYPQWALKYQL